MNETQLYAHQFTIQELSERLDIPKPTLRFWEKELGGVIVPLRTAGGQRRYTNIHITVLGKIKDLRDSGKSITEIKEYFNNGHDHEKPIDDEIAIDILTKKIAELVKLEVTKFLRIK
jgi:DNA-binding transcriptional MerR regulator